MDYEKPRSSPYPGPFDPARPTAGDPVSTHPDLQPSAPFDPFPDDPANAGSPAPSWLPPHEPRPTAAAAVPPRAASSEPLPAPAAPQRAASSEPLPAPVPHSPVSTAIPAIPAVKPDWVQPDRVSAPRPAASSTTTSRFGNNRSARILGLVVLALIVLGAAGLLLYRYYMHDDGTATVSGGVLTATPAGLYFRNTAENVAFVAPATWSRYPTTSAQVMVRGDGCSFGLLEQRTALSVSALANAEARDLKQRHPESTPIVAPRSLAGRNGLAFTGSYTDSEGAAMSQTYILTDRGSTVITLIETATDPACAQAFANIEDSLHL